MGIPAMVVLSMASLLVFTFLSCTHQAACELVLSQGEGLCRHTTRGDCTSAAGNICVWCDLPQQCFPAAHIQELGVDSPCFAVRSPQSRRLLEGNECGSIAKKDLCSGVDYCRWCRSELLDDTCFATAEAARLPIYIFDCSIVPKRL